jgi:hypothetical protein
LLSVFMRICCVSSLISCLSLVVRWIIINLWLIFGVNWMPPLGFLCDEYACDCSC